MAFNKNNNNNNKQDAQDASWVRHKLPAGSHCILGFVIFLLICWLFFVLFFFTMVDLLNIYLFIYLFKNIYLSDCYLSKRTMHRVLLFRISFASGTVFSASRSDGILSLHSNTRSRTSSASCSCVLSPLDVCFHLYVARVYKSRVLE